MSINWESILTAALAKLAEAFLPVAVDTGKKILEEAWQWAEDWAKDLLQKFGTKPSGEQKMAMAVTTAQASGLDLEPAAIRSFMEMEHLARTTTGISGKTAGA